MCGGRFGLGLGYKRGGVLSCLSDMEMEYHFERFIRCWEGGGWVVVYWVLGNDVLSRGEMSEGWDGREGFLLTMMKVVAMMSSTKI